MNTTTHLAELLTMPASEFDQYLELINQLAALRRNAEPTAAAAPFAAVPLNAAPPVPVAALPPAASIAPKRLATRPPMRAAKPGTLRGDIHDVLRSSRQPMPRSEIITAVANRRSRSVDKRLAAKISDLLTNRHDPYIEKVSRGVYAIQNN